MTELVLRNIDKTVLGKLNLSVEAREEFRKLLGYRVVHNKENPTDRSSSEGRNPDAENGLYNGA